jgi:hypothetical protein
MPALASELVRKIEIAQEGDTYKIGDFGPAGGRIIYDKGVFSNGWRYLEVAPLETEFVAEWGGSEKDNRGQILWKDINGLRDEVGFGKRNTQIIVEHLNQLKETGRAAQLCTSLNFDGFNDWFLPSRDELRLMFNQRDSIGLSSNGDYYWSSSSYATDKAISIYWSTSGYEIRISSTTKSSVLRVRAIRAF